MTRLFCEVLGPNMLIFSTVILFYLCILFLLSSRIPEFLGLFHLFPDIIFDYKTNF